MCRKQYFGASKVLLYSGTSMHWWFWAWLYNIGWWYCGKNRWSQYTKLHLKMKWGYMVVVDTLHLVAQPVRNFLITSPNDMNRSHKEKWWHPFYSIRIVQKLYHACLCSVHWRTAQVKITTSETLFYQSQRWLLWKEGCYPSRLLIQLGKKRKGVIPRAIY